MDGKFEQEEVKKAFWHTSSHVMAQAVKRLYPDTKCAIGRPLTMDFIMILSSRSRLRKEHLRAVEEEMRRIVKEGLPLSVREVKKADALAYMEKQKEDYKVEMIGELPDEETITFYQQGEYEEFCSGPAYHEHRKYQGV